MVKNDSLGDRMKELESRGKSKLLTSVPVVARLDGKAFHTFTRDLQRPFDQNFSSLMLETTLSLMKKTSALIGYTQSDEITLVWQTQNEKSEIFFSGRHEKMVSVLASYGTLFFNRHLPLYLPKKADNEAVFDCRVWNVPNETEAANCLIWRQQDATRNSISMAAQSLYTQNELMNKNCDEMQEMIFQKGINWNNYPVAFKRGSFIQRMTIEKRFSTEDIEKLPPKHAARQNPQLKVVRHVYGIVDMPQLTKVTNRNDVIFRGVAPQVANEKQQ